MSNKERIRRLEDGIAALTFGSSALRSRVEALESAVTLTDMGWATATEPEPPPHPDVLGKVEQSEWLAEVDAHSAPPTEPAPEASTAAIIAAIASSAPFPEPAPEPSPDKAERYTVERTYHGEYVLTFGDDQGGRLVATFENLADAERIAAALNSTPDPLLVGLVDACDRWVCGRCSHAEMRAAIEAHRPYLAGEGE